MGHIILATKELVSTISEAAGFKTGLSLSKDGLYELFPEDSGYKSLFKADDEIYVRLHSYDFDELFTNVLYYLGNIPSPTPMSHTMKLFHKYKSDPSLSAMYQEVQEIYILYMEKALREIASGGSKLIDPPLLLIQCKRHKEKIDRTVVKALWADMQFEKAESGLIVTTSSIAHGAKNDCIARSYNIEEADSEKIKSWIEKMRTPGAGVFMGG